MHSYNLHNFLIFIPIIIVTVTIFEFTDAKPSDNNPIHTVYEGSETPDGISGSAKNDILIGREEGDQIFGVEGNDSVYGGLGNDELHGGPGNDRIFGGEGNDWLIDNVFGRGNDVWFIDFFYGGDGDDLFYGDNGNDLFYGGDGDDFIDAGAGDDYVYGGEGNDYITVKGNAIITGGPGADIFECLHRNVTITDLTNIDKTQRCENLSTFNKTNIHVTNNTFQFILTNKTIIKKITDITIPLVINITNNSHFGDNILNLTITQSIPDTSYFKDIARDRLHFLIDTLLYTNATSIAASIGVIDYKPTIVSFDDLGEDTKKLINSISNNQSFDEDNTNPVKLKVIIPMKNFKDVNQNNFTAIMNNQMAETIVKISIEFSKFSGHKIERIFEINQASSSLEFRDAFHICIQKDSLKSKESTSCKKGLITNLDNINTLVYNN